MIQWIRRIPICMLCLGCAPGAKDVVRQVKAHTLEITTIVARLPPTPGNAGVRRQALLSYRQKHGAELARLEEDVRKIAASDDAETKLAVRAYCAMVQLLEPAPGAGQLLAEAKTPREALGAIRGDGQRRIDACVAALGGRP